MSPLFASAADVQIEVPPFGQGVFCESIITNVALATASSIEPQPADNLAVVHQGFNKASRAGFPEICDNGIDDNCDGRVDCFDSGCRSAPNCVVPDLSAALMCNTGLTPIPGLAIIS